MDILFEWQPDKERNSCYYIDTNRADATELFSKALYNFISNTDIDYNEIVIVCIGTDRATGDSLGPLTGSKLSAEKPITNVILYGTLDEPVHAKNLDFIIKKIRKMHLSPIIIAIDASLGKTDRIGYLKLGKGNIKPGASLSKNLPPIGDYFITGIVNFSGIMEAMVLQTTKLSVVMKMADIVSAGVYKSLYRLQNCVDSNL